MRWDIDRLLPVLKKSGPHTQLPNSDSFFIVLNAKEFRIARRRRLGWMTGEANRRRNHRESIVSGRSRSCCTTPLIPTVCSVSSALPCSSVTSTQLSSRLALELIVCTENSTPDMMVKRAEDRVRANDSDLLDRTKNRRIGLLHLQPAALVAQTSLASLCAKEGALSRESQEDEHGWG